MMKFSWQVCHTVTCLLLLAKSHSFALAPLPSVRPSVRPSVLYVPPLRTNLLYKSFQARAESRQGITMGDDDINLSISNGSCYWNVYVLGADNFIPCGNVAGGSNYACCQAGDKCLSSNACFNTKYGSTYLYGCTDPGYSAPACPRKGNLTKQAVVGLTRCDVEDDSEWAGCEGDGDTDQLQPPDSDTCTCSSGDALFRDAPTLTDIAILPTSLGGTISWYKGHSPTALDDTKTTRSTTRSAPSSSSSSSSSSSQTIPTTSGNSATVSPTLFFTSTLTGSAYSTPTSSAPTSSLSSGAKAGVGVGSVLGAALVAAVAYMAFLLRKRSQKGSMEQSPAAPEPMFFSPAQFGSGGDFMTTAPWTGFKSELPANESPVPQKLDVSGHSSPSPQFPACDRYSNISDLSSSQAGVSRTSSAFLSPPPIGQDQSQVGGGVGGRPAQSTMTPISELQG
ncbi:hypothetical protein F4778DRAFT_171805 [Xylariomycetidae sp. FL2044]|nr:hypothetical protein F4778DRAFT_171805 [Xylariomycetidae sp. FL2044]